MAISELPQQDELAYHRFALNWAMKRVPREELLGLQMALGLNFSHIFVPEEHMPFYQRILREHGGQA